MALINPKHRGFFSDITGFVSSGVSDLLSSGDPLSDIASEVWTAISAHMGDLVSQLFGGWFQDILNQAANYMPAIDGMLALPDEITTFLSTTLPTALAVLYDDMSNAIVDAFVAAFAIVGSATNVLRNVVSYADHQVKVVNQAIQLCTVLTTTLTNDIKAFAKDITKLTKTIVNFDIYMSNFAATLFTKFGTPIISGIIQDITTYSTERLNLLTRRITTDIDIVNYVDVEVTSTYEQPPVAYNFTRVNDEVDKCYDRSALRIQAKATIHSCTDAVNTALSPSAAIQALSNAVSQAESAVAKYDSSKTYIYVCYAMVSGYAVFVFIKCVFFR